MTRGEISKNSEQMRGEEVGIALFGGEARLSPATKECSIFPAQLTRYTQPDSRLSDLSAAAEK